VTPSGLRTLIHPRWYEEEESIAMHVLVNTVTGVNAINPVPLSF
jgi:hypothetical protein